MSLVKVSRLRGLVDPEICVLDHWMCGGSMFPVDVVVLELTVRYGLRFLLCWRLRVSLWVVVWLW